jgi:hypothetical protein
MNRETNSIYPGEVAPNLCKYRYIKRTSTIGLGEVLFV